MDRATLQCTAVRAAVLPGRVLASLAVVHALPSVLTEAESADTTRVRAGMPAGQLLKKREATPSRAESRTLLVVLLKRRLSRALLDTFYELTGLHLRARWHEPATEGEPNGFPVLCSRERQRHVGRLPDRCQTCLRKRRPCARPAQKPEKRFAGLCGSLNYCACVKALGQPCVTLSVQQPGPVSRARRQAFYRAVRIVRLVIHDLQATLQAAQTCCEPPPPMMSVGSACCLQPKEHQSAAAQTIVQPSRSCQRAEGTVTTREGQPATRPLPPGRNHSQLLVQRMRDYIHENYARPIQLADLAASVRLQPTYVSSLFSTTLGVTFHHYLEQVRLAKAKDLLRDPVARVSEVAYAVGYANPNHFRNVFTAHAGLSPSVWRDVPPSTRPSASSRS